MSAYCPARHRVACSLHLMQRVEERGVDLSADAIGRLEDAIERSRAAFVQPGQERYWIRVRHNGRRLHVLYDTRLCCLVTVGRVQ